MIHSSQGRLQDRRPLAVIDIGSNSVRLVVYEGVARSPTVLFNEKMMVGLGRGIVSTGRLDTEAVIRAVEELRRFRALATQAGAVTLHVIATAAVREAENGMDFVAKAEEILGVPIRVLSGKEEASYSAQGVISAFYSPDGIVGDLGGGSLELVDVSNESFDHRTTLPLGGLRLQEMAKQSLSNAAKIAREELRRVDFLKQAEGRSFYCVGGTWRNLARLHMIATGYPLPVMQHYKFDHGDLAKFLNEIAKGDIGDIDGIKSISKTRRALLPYGAVVLREIIDAMEPKNVVVSAFGVREGYLYSQLPEQERERDPLISAAEELAILRARSVTHARELAAWTDDAFDTFGIEETEEEARYRHAACLLADIGWRAHPEYRGTQSFNIIANGSFIGIDHPGRAFVALANLFRHEGINEDLVSSEMKALAGSRYVKRACILGALLRVVYLFSASMPGVIQKLKWQKGKGDALSLVVPASHADLIGERPKSRMKILADVLDRPMDIIAGD